MGVAVRMRYAVAAAVSAVTLLGSVTAVALTRGDGDVPGAGAGGHAEVHLRVTPFKIGGDAVKPLSPGGSAPIDVKFTNSRNTPLTVTELRVRVQGVMAPHADESHPCSRVDFGVRQVPSDFSATVPALASRTLSGLGVPRTSWPQVRMVNRPVNQDGCKGASLTLAYVGSGSLRR